MEAVLTQSIFFSVIRFVEITLKKINFLGLERSVFEKYTVSPLGIEGTSLGTQTESVVYSKLTKPN